MKTTHEPVSPSTDLVSATAGSVDPCGCEEGERAKAAVTRRGLLLAAAAAAGAVVTQTVGPDSALQLAFGSPGYSGDTIVVLSLRGGFDGLSAVAPVNDPRYAAVRPNIALPPSLAIQLDDTFGMHPALRPLQGLWESGQLAAVHSVGQPNPTRSHFAAMEEMENAAPGSHLRTGWIDRMVGLSAPSAFAAAAVGSNSAPASMLGSGPKMTLKDTKSLMLAGVSDTAEIARWTRTLTALNASAPASIKTPATAALGILGTGARLNGQAYAPANGAAYPKGALGSALQDVARLVKAKVGLRVATVDDGNWDMHVGLGTADSGWMFNQLAELGQALAAFASDLGDQMKNVTLVTLSEFGRRVAENGSGGLDHGHGNLCFVLGGGVRGGRVYGKWLGLEDAHLDNGDLAGTTDYRTILAEILEKRGGLSTGAVFPGLNTARLNMLTARA